MTLRKTTVLSISALAACALLAVSLPAAAAPATTLLAPLPVTVGAAPAARGESVGTAAAALSLSAGCGQGSDFLGAVAPANRSSGLGNASGPSCRLEDESPWLASSKPFHRFCACSCTHIPDCNTSADCGGAACLPAITCC
jgi:hypothetical protein